MKMNFSKHQSYLMSDIAEECKISMRTIQRWMDKGLTPIDPHAKPLLFYGDVITNYLRQKNMRRKIKLKAHEFYCLKCKGAVCAKEKSIQIITNRRHAQCAHCGTEINRYIGKGSVRVRTE